MQFINPKAKQAENRFTDVPLVPALSVTVYVITYFPVDVNFTLLLFLILFALVLVLEYLLLVFLFLLEFLQLLLEHVVVLHIP